MESEYPVATIVFLIITIFALMFSLILFQQLLADTAETAQEVLHGKRIIYEKRQEVANAFSNIVRAYEDCIGESGCVCDIYRISFPQGYSINIDNVETGTKITLLDKEKEILSETIRNINTGIMESGNECSSVSAHIKPMRQEWYVQKEESLVRNYFYDSVLELYKPDADNACFLTKTLSLKDSSIEEYFSTMPRCTYKNKKKEEQAFTALSEFVGEFKACAATKSECLCDFSRISLPGEYTIRIKEGFNRTTFTLVKLRTKFEPEEELLQLQANTEIMIEETTLSLKGLNLACIYSGTGTASLFAGCDTDKQGIDANELVALLFNEGKKVGFLARKGGLISFGNDDGKKTINRAKIPYCAVPERRAYNNAWPTEKFNNLYYVSGCFGRECNKGISIMQNEGAEVYAVEDGFVDSVDIKATKIVLKLSQGIKTEYLNVMPEKNLAPRTSVSMGQKIGNVIGSQLYFSLTDESVDRALLQPEDICLHGSNNTKAIAVEAEGNTYVNPACYFTEGIRSEIVYAANCPAPFRGCDTYGNEEAPKGKVRLKILAIPVNWERDLSYRMFADDALERFVRATPLKECPSRFSKILVDGKTDFGANWSGGSCRIEGRNNCYENALQTIKACAEQFKERTGEDYDFVVGMEDSNIAYGPECDYKDRGWTTENSDVVIVEAQYTGDTIHELGHKFGLKDQYCDCSSTNASELCGFYAEPNPLKEVLGCGSETCCNPVSEKNFPYTQGCRWCNGNLDINAKDIDSDNVLDKGKRTAMSNRIDAESYSIDEYLYLKAQPKLQCT